jgi:hypothetical protein
MLCRNFANRTFVVTLMRPTKVLVAKLDFCRWRLRFVKPLVCFCQLILQRGFPR